MVIPRKFRFYFVFCVIDVISMFGLSSTYYNVVLFVVLMQRFIHVMTGKIDLILKISNYGHRYVLHIL